MTAALYSTAKDRFLKAQIDLLSDNIKAVLLDATYTVDLSGDEFLSDIAGSAIVATSPNLANKTVSAGAFDADDVTFDDVSGDEITSIAYYKDTGVAGTSPLIAYDDDASGLPRTPDGTDITLRFSSGANKIFRLT